MKRSFVGWCSLPLLVLGLSCGDAVRAQTLTADETWSGVVEVAGDVTVPAGIKLTLVPGTTVRMSSHWNSIFVDGQLEANGTAAAPVTFTSQAGTAGNQWGGLFLRAGSVGVLDHVMFQAGGGESQGMLVISDPNQVTVQNSRFEASGEDGIWVDSVTNTTRVKILNCRFETIVGAGIRCLNASPMVHGCVFGEMDTPMHLLGTSFPDFNGDLSAPSSGVWLAGSTWIRSGNLEFPGIPYILDDDVTIPAGVAVTVEPKVVIKVDSYWNGFFVDGSLNLAGTGANPVVITSYRDDTVGGDTNGDGNGSVPGGDQWGGVVYRGTASGLVTFAEFRHGGGETAGMLEVYGAALVQVRNARFVGSGEDGMRLVGVEDPANVGIEACTFLNNKNDGMECNDASPTVVASTFVDNAGAIYLTGTSFPRFSGDLVAPKNGIWLAGTVLAGSGAWEYAGIPYILDGDVTVPAGRQLLLEPGVVVKGRNYWNSLFVDGQLLAEGTQGAPIVFTSDKDDTVGGDTNGDGSDSLPAPDQWGGVILRTGAGGSFRHCDFRYGGGELPAMLEIATTGGVTVTSSQFRQSREAGVLVRGVPDPAKAWIEGCAFEGNRGDAILCVDASPTVRTCTFTGNGSALWLEGTSYPDFQNDLTSNREAIWIGSAILQRDGHWKNPGVPYVLAGDITVPAGVTLSIDPGVIVKGRGYWESVFIDGRLLAQGTEAQPIVFTSLPDDTVGGDSNEDGGATLPAPDQWGGVLFRFGSTGVVHRVDFRYGGGELTGMVELDRAVSVTITNCSFRFSKQDGIRAWTMPDKESLVITSSRFEGNGQDGIACVDASPTIRACTFADSAIVLHGTCFPHFSADLVAPVGGVWIMGAALARDGVFENPGIPYVLAGDIAVPVNRELRIDPGVIIKGNNYWNSVIVDGRLVIPGTENQPVHLTAMAEDLGGDTNGDNQEPEPAVPVPDSWGGLLFREGSSGSLAHAHLRYGGGELTGLLEMDNARVAVSHSSFRFSKQYGVFISRFTLAGVPNAIQHSTIADNIQHGVLNASTKDLDATSNWWGDPTGPEHPERNPNGLGNAVSDYVLFEPFLTVPESDPTQRPYIITEPVSQTVDHGSPVLFLVVAGGFQPLAYQWMKDGKPIPGETLATLFLPSATLQSEGLYSVEVWNLVDRAPSQPARLTVRAPVVRDVNWAARKVELHDAVEAELLVRTGDIDNLGFGWPPAFDPFSGRSTPVHLYPWTPDPLDPEGTDHIMVVTSYRGSPPAGIDGYTQNSSRPFNEVEPVTLDYDLAGVAIRAAVLQVFFDDVQPLLYGSRFTAHLDGRALPVVASALNQLNQQGPIGKLMTFLLPAEVHAELLDGKVTLDFDDETTGAGDGFAIDFVRLLVNPNEYAQRGTVSGRVVDARSGAPIVGAVVSASGFAPATAGSDGLYTLANVPAGLTVVQATATGFVAANRVVDVLAGETTAADFALEVEIPIRITSISPETGAVRIAWEGTGPAFVLQMKTNLQDAAWEQVLVTGDRTALVPATGAQAFYRLMRVVTP